VKFTRTSLDNNEKKNYCEQNIRFFGVQREESAKNHLESCVTFRENFELPKATHWKDGFEKGLIY
jgi:hypothetical protein